MSQIQQKKTSTGRACRQIHYRLAEHCGYEALHDEMIRDRIVVGITNSASSEKLQLDADLTKVITSG